MQTRVTPSFRLIGLATCLSRGTLGCTEIHDDGAPPSRVVRVANPSPVEPAPSAAAPSGTPMLLRIEDIGPLARIASERVLEAAARVHEAEAHADATLGEVFLPKLDADGSCWRSDRQLAIKTQLGPLRVASHTFGIELVRATQPLLDVADFFYRYGAERAAVDVARLAAVRAADVAELEAVRAFYEILSRREEIVALERSVHVLESHVTDTGHRFAAGRSPENDITKVDLELSRRQQALLAAAWTADHVPRIQGFIDDQYDVNDALQDNDAFEGGVQAQVRLFDGLARERHRDEVRAQRQTLASRRRDLERRIAIEVEEARLAVEEQHNALAVAQRSVAQAEASLRVEDDLYRHDKSTAAAVLDSELTLFEGRVDAAHARYGMLVASAALKTATGGGLP